MHSFDGEEFFIISLSEGSERSPDSLAFTFSACRTLSRCRYTDTMPTDSSPTGQVVDRTYHRQESSPTGYFANRTFRRQDISPTGRFVFR